MSYLKRRLAVFLSVLVAFTTIFFVVPQEEVQAATAWIYMPGGYASEVRVEKGAKDVYIGDYLTAYCEQDYTNYGLLSNNSGVKYSSSKKSVAAVDSSTGKLTAKKTGTTTISAKFKGRTYKFKLRVVSSLKSVRESDDTYSEKDAAAKAFVKQYGSSKITTKNRYDKVKAYADYAGSGYAGGDGLKVIYESGKAAKCIYMPNEGRAVRLVEQLRNYNKTRNPFSTISSKCFKVKSISGSGKTITINLKKAVSAEQMFGANVAAVRYGQDNNIDAKKVIAEMYVRDSNYKYYPATMTIEKGSKKLTIKLKDSKLKKGKKYYLDYNGLGDWLYKQKNSFTAK